MAAGYQELFVEQGANYSTSITLDDSNGDAFDLTDYQAKCQMKKSYYSTNATAEFTTTITSPGNFQVYCAFDQGRTKEQDAMMICAQRGNINIIAVDGKLRFEADEDRKSTRLNSSH